MYNVPVYWGNKRADSCRVGSARIRKLAPTVASPEDCRDRKAFV
jgi:hypothetical protein